MSEIPRLLDQLRRAFDGEPWSGPSLLTNLAGITAAQAAQHPIKNAHSIWEITHHVAVWSDVVCRRLLERKLLQISDAEDWPTQPENPTEADWQALLTILRTAHSQLLNAASVAGAVLDQPIGEEVNASSIYATLHGVAQHYLYHAGQVVLLRKLVV